MKGNLVEVLHASVDFALMRVCIAEIYYVEQVGKEKHVDANIRVLQTRHRDYRKSQPAKQEHNNVDILTQFLGPNAQVQATNSLPHFLFLESFLSLVQDSSED